MDERGLLERAKVASTLQLLIRCARRVDERARERINSEAGRSVARPSTMALLPHVDLGGTRVSDLADKLQITKQAVSRRVGELVEEGILELVDDPADGRARLVRFTPHGLDAIHHGLSVLRALEDELAAELGAEELEALRRTLIRLDAAL